MNRILSLFAMVLCLALPVHAQAKNLLVFTRIAGPSFNLAVVNADGTGLRMLDGERCYDPALSPDGRQIAYVRMTGPTTSTLELRPVDGGAGRKICDVRGVAFGPTWSPDQKRLACSVIDDKTSVRGPVLAVVNVDGSGFHAIGGGNECFPSWSPDGRQILFGIVDEPKHAYGVGIIDVERGSRRIIHPSDHAIVGTRWAPDGKQIVFIQAMEDKSSQLFVMPAAGGKPSPLTRGGGARLGVDYSLDGKVLCDSRVDEDGTHYSICAIRPGPNESLVEVPLLQAPAREMYALRGASMLLMWAGMRSGGAKPPTP